MLTRILVAFVFCAIASSQANAAGYVGGGLGIMKPDVSDEADAKLGIQAKASGFVNENVALGGYLQSYRLSEDGASLAITPVLFDVSYYMEGAAPGGYFGGRIGIVRETIEVAGFDFEETETTLGVHGGFTFPTTPKFSLGIEGSLLRVFGDPKGYNIIGVFGTGIFWF